MMKHNQRGSILLIFIIVLPFMMLIAIYYSQLALTSFRVARQDQLRTSAQLAADAGADFAVGKISQDNTWLGTGGEITLLNETRTRTTYDVTVTDTANSHKSMAVIGRSYTPATSTTPEKTVKIIVDLRPVASADYGIISGQGGLYMSNQSKIVGGGVFVNGEIKMSNSAQIGLSTKPIKVEVAHQICPNPPDATFPKVCNSGEFGEPITIANPALIYGEVTATNQTSGAGMSNPGLVAGSVAPKPLPTYNRTAQIAAVANTITGPVNCSGSTNILWPANTKVVGDVNVSGKCTITVEGNVWITGNLKMTNTSVMKVADIAGSTPPNVMVDGASGVNLDNSAILASNSVKTGFRLYTYWSDTTCSPNCSSVTGTELFNSRGVTTISLANTASGPNTVFYSVWSQVSVANSGAIGAIIGQTILMSNSATLTFGASAEIGGPVTYVVQSYRRG